MRGGQYHYAPSATPASSGGADGAEVPATL